MAFECPRGTRFQQRTMVCDHEHLVECHQSAKYFHSNLRIGQANVNFIDDKQRSSSKYGYLLNMLLTIAFLAYERLNCEFQLLMTWILEQRFPDFPIKMSLLESSCSKKWHKKSQPRN